MGAASLEDDYGKHMLTGVARLPGSPRSCQVGVYNEERLSTPLQPVRLRVLT